MLARNTAHANMYKERCRSIHIPDTNPKTRRTHLHGKYLLGSVRGLHDTVEMWVYGAGGCGSVTFLFLSAPRTGCQVASLEEKQEGRSTEPEVSSETVLFV